MKFAPPPTAHRLGAEIARFIRKSLKPLRLILLKTPLVSKADRQFPLTHVNSRGYSLMNIPLAEEKIKNALLGNKSCMIARLGRIEAISSARLHFMLEKKNILRKSLDFITWKNDGFLYDPYHFLSWMKTNAGFYPITKEALTQYYHLCLQDMRECDMLASWVAEERVFNEYLSAALRIPFCLGSFLYSENPWTAALEGKKVLVIHPFSASIESQYARREQIFPQNPRILPDFQLQTIQAVQSIADEQPDFPHWFAALDHMKNQINARDFDIALIGCGAYGFNLAAHVKRLGKKAVHVGGDLQYLFGISSRVLRQGEHWPRLVNEAWISPAPSETPKGAHKVENACYW